MMEQKVLVFFVCSLGGRGGGSCGKGIQVYEYGDQCKGYCKKNLALFLLTNFSALVSGKEDIS